MVYMGIYTFHCMSPGAWPGRCSLNKGLRDEARRIQGSAGAQPALLSSCNVKWFFPLRTTGFDTGMRGG